MSKLEELIQEALEEVSGNSIEENISFHIITSLI